jgi:hypothetical protein
VREKAQSQEKNVFREEGDSQPQCPALLRGPKEDREPASALGNLEETGTPNKCRIGE